MFIVLLFHPIVAIYDQVGVLHCDDNDVTHKYNYLVCVVTGWWKEAGTTANVFIYIQGELFSLIDCIQHHKVGSTWRQCK